MASNALRVVDPRDAQWGTPRFKCNTHRLPMTFQELQTLERLNWVLLGSNANTHRPLMMLEKLQTLERFNGILLGSNANTHRLLMMLENL